MKIPKKVENLLEIHRNKGVKLDLGCGENKNAGCIGIDKRDIEGVDIVWDLETIPYPLPDECASIIIAASVVQQIKPWLFIDVMNEWWRIMKTGGELLISTPYANSFGFHQDPMNIKGFNEAVWAYFDPLETVYSGGALYKVYKPKPWKIKFNAWNLGGALEIILEKRKMDKFYTK